MKVVADLHTHTLLSGHAYSTLAENARAAAERGLGSLAVTEHGPAMPGANASYFHFANLSVVSDQLCGVRILRGAEVNILDGEGGVDVPDWVLARLELVLAGLHDVCIGQADPRENTRRLVRVMEAGRADVICHPDNPHFPVDIPALVEAAGGTGVALEVNEASLSGTIRPGSAGICREILEHCRRRQVRVALASDAHWAGDIGRMERAVEMVQQAGIPPQQVLSVEGGDLEGFVEERMRIRRERLAPA